MLDQRTVDFLGTESVPITLTGSYSNSNANIGSVAGAERVSLYVYYTMGSGETNNSIEIKIETAPQPLAVDSLLWSRQVTEFISSGVRTLSPAEFKWNAVSAAGTYDCFEIPLEINTRHFKVSVKETGISSNGGKCYIKLVVNGR